MKKIYLLLASIMLISLVVAGSPLGTFKQNNNVSLIQTCADCTFNNITSIKLGDGSVLIVDKAMSQSGSYFNYSLNSTYTSSLGKYIVNGIGDVGGTNTVWTYGFDVTHSGISITSGQAMIYIPLFLFLIFLFVIVLLGINKLPQSNQVDEDGRLLSVTYLKYFRPVGWMFEWMLLLTMMFLSSNLAFAYLHEQLFAEVLLTFFKVGFGITPLIITVWLISIFVGMYHDKQFQQMLNRGIFPEGRNF